MHCEEMMNELVGAVTMRVNLLVFLALLPDDDRDDVLAQEACDLQALRHTSQLVITHLAVHIWLKILRRAYQRKPL
jgi:hypothetical protein